MTLRPGYQFVGAAIAAAAGVALVRRAIHVRAVAPELRTAITWVPLAVTSRTGLLVARRLFARPTTPVEGVSVDQWEVLRPGGHVVSTFLYRSDSPPGVSCGHSASRESEGCTADSGLVRASGAVGDENLTAPGTRRGALLWIHGGGTILGIPEGDHDLCSQLARDADVIVVNVNYRLAPEDPFPAGLEDCYAVLRELHTKAETLGIDPARIAIGGASAGGGIAAALGQLAYDRGEVPVVFQLLVYPMLDDRTVLRNDHGGRDHLAWTPRSNAYAWTSYLGHEPRANWVAPYAAAARREDLSGLPRAWVGVGSLDLFYEEDLAYADRLKAASVACEVHVEPRMPHGADVATPQAPSMVAFRSRMTAALHSALQ